MKNTSIAVVVGLFVSTAAFAAHQKPADLPECQDIVKQCEAPNFGFEPNEHKANGKGLWVDCIAKRAHGDEVKSTDGQSQISATPEQAKACLAASKKLRRK